MAFGGPKLGRSSRSFAREVAIVIVGVLVALALEQVASDWRDSRRADNIRASMDEEIADFSDVFTLRLAAGRCVTAKLDAIDRLLAGSGGTGPWRQVGRPPFYFSSQGAWSGDASDLLSRHLGAARLRLYGEIYQGMTHFQALLHQEQQYWITLQTLERQDEPIAGERRWALLEAAAGARNSQLLIAAISEQMLANGRRLGVAPHGTTLGPPLQERPICRPLQRGGANG
jgi:hypothetical protein